MKFDNYSVGYIVFLQDREYNMLYSHSPSNSCFWRNKAYRLSLRYIAEQLLHHTELIRKLIHYDLSYINFWGHS